MSDDIIGSITGTATFDYIVVSEKDYGRVEVIGVYGEDTTHYTCAEERIRIGGFPIRQMEGYFELKPVDDDDWVWVEATEDKLIISTEKPGDEKE
jgi:hypothetical protein